MVDQSSFSSGNILDLKNPFFRLHLIPPWIKIAKCICINHICALERGFLNQYNYGDWIITLYIFFRCTRKIKSIIKKNKVHYVLYWSYIFLLCPCSLLLWLLLLFRILQIIIFFLNFTCAFKLKGKRKWSGSYQFMEASIARCLCFSKIILLLRHWTFITCDSIIKGI